MDLLKDFCWILVVIFLCGFGIGAISVCLLLGYVFHVPLVITCIGILAIVFGVIQALKPKVPKWPSDYGTD